MVKPQTLLALAALDGVGTLVFVAGLMGQLGKPLIPQVMPAQPVLLMVLGVLLMLPLIAAFIAPARRRRESMSRPDR